jgi:hypothetical protein
MSQSALLFFSVCTVNFTESRHSKQPKPGLYAMLTWTYFPSKGMLVSVKPCIYTLKFCEISFSPTMNRHHGIAIFICILSYMRTFINLPNDLERDVMVAERRASSGRISPVVGGFKPLRTSDQNDVSSLGCASKGNVGFGEALNICIEIL